MKAFFFFQILNNDSQPMSYNMNERFLRILLLIIISIEHLRLFCSCWQQL